MAAVPAGFLRVPRWPYAVKTAIRKANGLSRGSKG